MKQVQASNNQLTLFLYIVIVARTFSYKPLDICSEMVKVADVLNLNMSNLPVTIFCEYLVSIIDIERTSGMSVKMNSMYHNS